MQLHGGPMDGAFAGDCDLKGGVLERGIKRKTLTFGDGKTTAPIWRFANERPECVVVYRLNKDGKLIHFHTERLLAL